MTRSARDIGEELVTRYTCARFTPLLDHEIKRIVKRYPGIPEDYIEFLRHVGHGTLVDFSVFRRPLEPGDWQGGFGSDEWSSETEEPQRDLPEILLIAVCDLGEWAYKPHVSWEFGFFGPGGEWTVRQGETFASMIESEFLNRPQEFVDFVNRLRDERLKRVKESVPTDGGQAPDQNRSHDSTAQSATCAGCVLALLAAATTLAACLIGGAQLFIWVMAIVPEGILKFNLVKLVLGVIVFGAMVIPGLLVFWAGQAVLRPLGIPAWKPADRGKQDNSHHRTVELPNCPKCNSTDVVPIVYGHPGRILLEMAHEGLVKLGGCRPGDLLWSCSACGREWGRSERPDKYEKVLDQIHASFQPSPEDQWFARVEERIVQGFFDEVLPQAIGEAVTEIIIESRALHFVIRERPILVKPADQDTVLDHLKALAQGSQSIELDVRLTSLDELLERDRGLAKRMGTLGASAREAMIARLVEGGLLGSVGGETVRIACRIEQAESGERCVLCILKHTFDEPPQVRKRQRLEIDWRCPYCETYLPVEGATDCSACGRSWPDPDEPVSEGNS